MDRQNWSQDKCNFLKSHISPKGQANRKASCPRPEEPVHLQSFNRHREYEDHMSSDTTKQDSVSSPGAVPVCSSADQVMDQFAQMITMLSSFLWPKQESARTAFCNYLTLEVEALEDEDFQTYRNEAVNFLAASKARQRKAAVSPNNHSNRQRSSSATSTFVTHNHGPPFLQPPPPQSKNISSHQPSLSLLHYQLTPNSSSSRTTALASNRSFSGPLLLKKVKVLFKTTQVFQKQ